MINSTLLADLPPLPTYTLKPLPPLVYPIPDKYLSLILPVVAYWVVSLAFHWIDVNDYFPQYRLHTPAEVLRRNHVSRGEVLRDVIIQQVIQTACGVFVGHFDPDPVHGSEDYDVAVWAQRIRIAQKGIPLLLNGLGLDSHGLAQRMNGSFPLIAGAVNGGHYPWLTQSINADGVLQVAPAFASWELSMAKLIYWLLIPALQFGLAIVVMDTWQYFWHRAMHVNKWLYVNIHARHHRLYVPYAYGALYNHPVEGFLLDTLGAIVAYLLSGMTNRQAMWLFTCSSIKTVDDHCGYSLPWDPLQRLTSNNAGYHDIHHQTWGIKKNFSQPFFTFWDSFMGTKWTGGDVSAKYEKARMAAGQIPKVEVKGQILDNAQISQDLKKTHVMNGNIANGVTSSMDCAQTTLKVPPSAKGNPEGSHARSQKASSGEMFEETEQRVLVRRSPRKKAANSASQSAGLKGLHDRVYGSLHGRGSGVLGVESSQ